MKRLSRNNRGSMLVLVMCGMFLIVVIVTQLSGFGAMLFAHRKLENQAEATEIRAVEILNEADRSGRFNMITSASRELVFDSRRTFNEVAQVSPEYLRLAELYLDQSRQGAQTVAQEREKIVTSALTEERALAVDINKSNQFNKLLPWAAMRGLSVYSLDLGYSQGEDSNVRASIYDPDLFAFDEQNKSFNPDTKLYHGNISLKLPGLDQDLDFKLSSLPAPVSGTTAQARIDQGDKFVPTMHLISNGEFGQGNCEYIPSRARLVLVENFENTLGVHFQERIAASVSGTANGAGEPAI